MQLEVLNYEKLRNRDEKESRKLLRLSSDAGIFFLDLRGAGTTDLLSGLQPVIEAQRVFFAQDSASKQAFASELEGRGYDSFDEVSVQRLKLSREQQIQGSLKLPPSLEPVQHELATVVSSTDAVLRDMTTMLCGLLDPPIATTCVDNPERPGISNVCLGLADGLPGTALMGSHLDDDLLTITFYDEPFLEILDEKDSQWKLVEVFEHLPIVNVGTTLQRASNNRLRAPYHRVVQTPSPINLIMYDLNACPA
ncbi:hypothetical protein PWT90_06030 [Aphanocladium album]|nr:hypothetical protein PWT90_06030 [Aphanocladium album]